MKVNSNLKLVDEVYRIAVEQNLEVVEFKDKDTYVKIKRRGKKKHELPVAVVEPKQIIKEEKKEEPKVNYIPIKSPLNGIFYRSASPQGVPFVQEGSVVESGAILCIVEAMKVMNEIRAPAKLKIYKILVENGQTVQADQEIFLTLPAE